MQQLTLPAEEATEMAKQSEGRSSSKVVAIRDLVNSIGRGEIKVPRFQREFVWKDDQAITLLDSVAKNYPIGSVLLWRTRDKLLAERNIGEFSLPSTDDLDATDYVLDGQQRLTVLYCSLGAPVDAPGFCPVYDLRRCQFEQRRAVTKAHEFTLRALLKTRELLNFRTALQSLPDADELQDRLDALFAAFDSYQIPLVTLKGYSVDEVCPIFERINSSGTRLSNFDLVSAATWSTAFDLREEVAGIEDALSPKASIELGPSTVLKCLTSIATGTLKQNPLGTLRTMGAVELEALTNRTKEALLQTIDLLSTEFGVVCEDFLPSDAVVVLLANTLARLDKVTSERRRRLRSWFWTSCLSGRYRSFGDLTLSGDLTTLYEFVSEGRGMATQFGQAPTRHEWTSFGFRRDESRTRAFILALASRRPRSLLDGAAIDCELALHWYNKRQFHHVHPRAHLRRTRVSLEENLLLNVCILPAGANLAIRDSDPQAYLPACAAALGEDADSVFASNLLPLPAYESAQQSDYKRFDYLSATYQEFIQMRAVVVEEYISHLCSGASVPAGMSSA